MKLFLCILFIVSVKSEYNGIPGNLTRSPCTDKNHIVLVPGVLTAGGSSRVCLSRFHAEGTALLHLTLHTEDKLAVSAERSLPPGDGGCIDIAVPQLPNTEADVVVRVRYPESQCTWSSRLTARIAGARVVALHTERGRYRPGDTVRVRALALKPDLTPVHGIIDELWLEGPRGLWVGSRAAEWRNLRSRMGLVQVQHQLDRDAPPGVWTVRVRLADGSQGSTTFYVGNYELPPFQLSVRHAPRVLRTSERLVWTVCVRYPWTEAVEGMLVIRIRGAGTPTSSSSGIRTAVRLRAPRACHRHAAAARRIGLHGDNAPDVVVADFSFQEEGTRIWQNTTVVSQVVDKPVTLEFLTKQRTVISPGLPYKIKIKATRWDDKHSANERVRVCRSPASQAADLSPPVSKPGNGLCMNAVTDATGIARVTFSASDDGSPFYRLQAFLFNDTTTSTEPLYLPVLRQSSVHASLGPIRPDNLASRTFVPLYLSANGINTAITVHFVVITRGGIIYRWGATTQCPVTNLGNHIHTAAKNSPCNLAPIETNAFDATFDKYTVNDQEFNRYSTSESLNDNMTKAKRGYTNNAEGFTNAKNNTSPSKLTDEVSKFEVNTSDSLLDRQLLRVMLPIKVTQQMCPDSHLIAYFYYNEELISASKHFEMDECFANKVEATWVTRQTAPGATTSLSIATSGPALCALTVIDTAAKWQHQGRVKELLVANLRRMMDRQRNLTEYDAAGECFLTSDSPDLPTNHKELMFTWLASAGVRILGGEPTGRMCRPPPAMMVNDDVTVPRSDFSEAWLWRLIAVGANGTVIATAQAPDSITRFEATALCIARNGVGISAPSVLQVFREFFIHADGPNRLRSGDSAILRYRVFNYLYEPLAIEIQIVTDSHIEAPSYSVETVCVAARSSIARRVEISAKQPGAARINVRAKSVLKANCGNATVRSDVGDEIIILMTIDPEGIPVHEEKSALLCAKGSAESSTSKVSWNWPEVHAVPGTEMITVWALADMVGPLFADADDLVMLPRGCGEQNMARLATNLLALQYLDPKSPEAYTAKEHVARGFTRQLQYAHLSGGFSAFGASDGVPSTWLTAFAVRYLRKAHEMLTPDFPAPPALDRAEKWLLSQQMENGCFRNEGQVFHRELRGGLNEDGEIASVALTAYVITSLIDSSPPVPSHIIRNSLSCLRALPRLKTKNPAKIYAHSLLAYAFMKLKSYEKELRRTNEASLVDRREGLELDEELMELMELLKLSERSGEYVWWETDSLSTSIEATSYAVLALSKCPAQLRETCAHDARAAIRWLSTHRNAAGGFVATQDTLIALEALTSWSSVQPSSPTNLTVNVQSVSDKATVNLRSAVKIPDVLKMGDGRKVSVNVEGAGCALVQATRSYHSYAPAPRDQRLNVQVSVHTDGAFNCDGNDTNCFCAAVVQACVLWTGAFPEMALLEVTLPGGFGADPALLYSQLKETDILLRRIELTPNSGRATLYLGTRDGSAVLAAGHRCYSIHAVGAQVRTKPAHVKLTDYYKPVASDTQMYTIPEECLPRISHDTDQYIASDNLYSKAKSLSGDEVIISHEFTFDDIPDGIPLEDPLYDNLKQDTINDSKTLNIPKLNSEFALLPASKLKHKINDKIDKINDTNYNEHNEDGKINSTVLNNKIHDKNQVNNLTVKRDESIDMSSTDQITNISNRRKVDAFKQIERQSKSEEKTVESQNQISKTQPEEHRIQIRDESQEYNQEIAASGLNQSEMLNISTKNVKQETAGRNPEVDNPNLLHFHVIDTEKDLEVPSGLEGPVPSVVLPPANLNSPRSYLVPPSVSSSYEAHYHPYNSWYRPPGPHISKSYDPRPPIYFYRPVEDTYWRNIRNRRYNSPTG